MNFRSGLAVVGAVLALTGAIIAWRSYAALREARASLVAAQAERAKAARDWTAQQAHLATAHAAQRAQAAQAEGKASSASPGFPAPAANSRGPIMAVPRDNPELQARAVQALKAGLFVKYGAFYRALGLSAAQIAAFEDMLVEHEGRLLDIRTAERGRPIDRANATTEKRKTIDGREVEILVDASIAALRRDEQARFSAAQLALLGETGVAQLRDFDDSVEPRSLVNELAGNLAFTATPLSAEQGRQVQQLLRDGKYAGKLGTEPVDWDTILRNAAGVLAPRQLAELEYFAARAKRDEASQQLTRLAKKR